MTNPSGGGNNPAGGGNNPAGGGNNSGEPPPSITSLTGDLKQIPKNEPADLKLDTGTLDKYLGATSTFLWVLIDARKQMNDLGDVGNVGNLPSAQQTKNNLDLDVTGLTGIQKATDQYIGYLEQFEATMIQAATRLFKSG